jgi:hypothetical protein
MDMLGPFTDSPDSKLWVLGWKLRPSLGGLSEKPGAPFGLIDPALDQAGRSHIVESIAKLMAERR